MNGDIQVYDEATFGTPGEEIAVVAALTAAQKINAGEPIYIAVNGGNVATALATNLPSSANAASNISGIATSNSTDTVAAAGTVRYLKLIPGTSYLIAAKIPATAGYNTTTGVITQATYDALVGNFVLLDLTGTALAKTATYTALIAHNAAYGCVIEPLDITKYPGMVRFSIRTAATTKGWATGIS